MIISIKKCKECGEEFTPDNPRQNFCKKDHYRPCPICSKPVLIKYLTDPTPCCSKECTMQKRAASKAAVKPTDVAKSNQSTTNSGPKSLFKLPIEATSDTSNILLDVVKKAKVKIFEESHSNQESSGVVYQYIKDKEILGFIPGHKYELSYWRDSNNSPYSIAAKVDRTTGEEVSLFLHLTSMNSINQWFLCLPKEA